MELHGAQGPLAGALRVAPLILHVGGLPLLENAPLAVDLRTISQAEGIEIAGILGYSMLGRSPFTLDLHNGTVEFAGVPSLDPSAHRGRTPDPQPEIAFKRLLI